MLMHIHRLLSQKQNSRFSRTLLFYGTIFLLMLLQLPRGTLSVNCEDFCEGERDRWQKDDPDGVFMFECEQYTNWIDQVACLDNCDCVRKETTVTNCVNGKFTCAKKKKDYVPPEPSRYEPDHYMGHGGDNGNDWLLMLIFVDIVVVFGVICCIASCVAGIIGFIKRYRTPPPVMAMPIMGMGYAQPQPQIIQTQAPASSSTSTN